MEEGYLNIAIASIVFIGMNASLTANVKHTVFQEPLTTLDKSQSISHDIYFRAEGDSTIRKIQPNSYDDIIRYSMTSDKSVESTDPDKSDLDKVSKDPVHQGQDPHQDSKVKAVKKIRKPTSDQDSIQSSASNHQDSVQNLALNDQDSIQNPTSDDSVKRVNTVVNKSDFSYESANVKGFIKYLMQFNITGKMELYHVFNCDNEFGVSEIFKIFTKNMSLCVLVTEDLNLSMLEENETIASRGLYIGSNNMNLEGKNAVLQQFSSFLLSNRGSYIFSMKDALSNAVLNGALSSSTSKAFPLSWYYFGFKLQEIMISKNLNIISVSKDCMIIAEQLKMDKSATIAALQHLTENNMLLYFRDVMNDVVFASVHIFSKIFSKLYLSSNSAIVSKELIDQATKLFAVENFFDKKDFIKCLRS